jgi:hypothetical protein
MLRLRTSPLCLLTVSLLSAAWPRTPVERIDGRAASRWRVTRLTQVVRRILTIALVSVPLSFHAATLAQQGIRPAVRPNVLLIVLDDVGREVDFYGMGVPTRRRRTCTCCANSVLFHNAYVQPPAARHAAMLTGRYAYRTGWPRTTTPTGCR